MSSNQLNNSIIPEIDDFPKEAIFQHLFLAGLAAETPPYVCICSELGKRFPRSPEEKSLEISGEIDFYVDGNIRWGIELLTKGDRKEEHLVRCRPDGGKYASLEMLDYAVVDFRRGGNLTISKIKLDPKRMTVVFPFDSFQTCKVIIGLNPEPINIALQP